jgi:hypothetical protein
MIALSIRQPWAWLIVNGHKDVENRTWTHSYKGPLLVHAGKAMTRAQYRACAEVVEEVAPSVTLPAFDALERGGIVGQARVLGWCHESASPWFFGPYAFMLADARPLPFHSYNGALGYFDVPWP